MQSSRGPITSSVAADFDGDGYADLATFAAPDLDIHLGTGHGTFQPPVVYTVGPGSVLAGADLNGDGRVDLVVSGDGVTVLANRGDGTFTVSLNDPTLSSVQLGDVDGDGDLDILAGDFRGNLQVGMNLGGGQFGAVRDAGAPGLAVGTTAVGDVDGDHKVDIVYSAGSHIMIGRGDGSFVESPHAVRLGGSVLTLADLDGDGSLDIVARDTGSSVTPSIVHLLANDGRGNFVERATTGVLAGATPALVADVNCDSKPELVFVGRKSAVDDSVITVLISQGAGTFAAENYTGGLPLTIGDLNADGKPDLVIGWGNFASILTNLGDGTFLEPQDAFEFPRAGLTNAAAVTIAMASADLDGDGTLDFAVVNNYYGAPTPSGVFNSLVAVLLSSKTQGLALSPKDYPLSMPGNSYELAVGDLDGDGQPDLALLNGATTVPRIEAYLSRGSGVFAAPVVTPFTTLSSSSFTGIAAGDLDGDGKADLVTTGPGVNIWFNRGDATFLPPIHFDSGLPLSLTVRDVNGDGKLDITVTTRVGTNDARTLLNQGNRTFAPFIGFPSADTTDAVAIEDVDGDGKVDLVTVGSRKLRVLRGFNQGSFAIDESYDVRDAVKSGLVVRDFDGDGKVDLAIPGAGVLEIMRNLGNGTFDHAIPYAAPGIRQIAASDFDGDARQDIVTFGPRVAVFRNNGCLR